MNDCLFCSDLQRAGEIIYSGDAVSILLHPDSAVRGHAMVVSTRHVENLSDLPDDEARQFLLMHRIAEQALLDATGTDRAILLKLGIQVPHLHVHIYPVSASMTRAEVMKVIEGERNERRGDGFADALRERVKALTPPLA